MKQQLIDFFSNSNYAFVVMFGSFANNTNHSQSDVDIGVFFAKDVDCIALGYDSAKLESLLGKKVDFVVLNDIEKKDPSFAFEILKNHELLLQNNQEIYVSFKTKVQLSYLDHKPLIELNQNALKQRLEEQNFARRDFA